MLKIYGQIYLIRNKINNKCYIGQTTNEFKIRYNYNLIKNTHNEYLRKSLIKYGKENFEIIENFDIAYSKEELDKLEEMYIKAYNLIDRNFGYNRRLGGSNGKMNKDVRKIMSINHTGLKNHSCKKIVCLNDNKVFDYIGEAAKYYNINSNSIVVSIKRNKRGITDRNLIFVYYDDYIKLSKDDINAIIYCRQNYKKKVQRKKVVCLTTGEIFESVSDACEKYNLGKSNVSKCCQGDENYNHCGKLENGIPLTWRYYEDYEKLDKKNINKILSESLKPKKHAQTKVMCITTNKIFDSIKEANKYYGLSPNNRDIGQVCSGKRKHAGKLKDGTLLKWKYI